MAENKRESVGNLNVKVEVDVSKAIKGLKAVQRAAKDAAKALAELDAAMRGYEKTPNNRRKGGCGTVESPYALDWRRVGVDFSE
ncbi:hypothetical protein FO510_05560 [Bacillus pumilus]|uniref:hypothetical protein n=1 Tax=Bacillus pumilus TaxID=1408 RepID=UPI00017A5F4B|nr:hypothetical protein [Bacillus pumilus]EDW22361.1 conserved hypothetical protein [Bacillus pumilus ATCC 7061]MCR4352163.1 hypothetical protein [Bacillus pumilus]MCY7503974.1 hypothetical protein [Bacillus pumilus]MDR4269031.1 hypothetical protein [Bacillus pumilus]MDR4269118.1 hypothetical protein [Bacillus pumilus]